VEIQGPTISVNQLKGAIAGRYEHPKSVGWDGWIETPEAILYYKDTGETAFYRRNKTGAIIEE
jgi:hypothetical protein